MCGIVGYIGKRNSLPILIDGLKRLEYRGYDSAGIAFQNGSGIEIYKTKGKIKDLQKILPHPTPDAMIGLGHTRWATHGAPSSRNAHPHRADGIAVVHNGIIENYRNLRSQLIAEGHKFSSDTDTEVIPQMISSYLQKKLPIRDAIKETIAHLRGTFAIGIMIEAHPKTLFSIRKGSPLVIGIGDGEFFFASDVSALLPYTRRFIFMEDGQICTIGEEGIELRYLDSQETTPVEEQAVEIDWTPSMAEKEGYNHFMLKEIHEQPRAMMDTIREWTEDPERILDEFGLTVKRTIGLNKLQIVACGTSYHAALVGKYMIEDIARIPVDVEIASEFRYKSPIIEHDSLFISITQSGEMKHGPIALIEEGLPVVVVAPVDNLFEKTLSNIEEVKARGGRVIAITDEPGALRDKVDDLIAVPSAHSSLSPLVNVIPLQLLAYYIGMLRGCDVDQPRNLAKSVTVE